MLRRHRLAPAFLAAALPLLAAPAVHAAPPQPPMLLPGDAAAASVRADPSTWLVGARPGARSARVAARHGGKRVAAGVYVIPRGRARELAGALRAAGTLTFAEPNRLARAAQAPPPDPLDGDPRWRDVIVAPGLAPPVVGPASPLLALVDARLDETHPEFGGGNVSTLGDLPLVNAHGTETASVAAAPKNDQGILGVWPGMRALNVPLPGEITCADSTAGIGKALAQGATVVNMSYGSPAPCFAEYTQLQLATAKGVTLVAAAGNEFAEGNLLQFPASLPHVLTVAAVGADRKAAYFSNANAAVDLSAPGVAIVAATPPQFDVDGTADGYEAVTGTSFSAPMVAAAAAWVRALRPTLSADQVSQLLRLSAVDLERKGWDPSTGFGMLSVGRALAARTPRRDPLEPNDDVVWVDGSATGTPEPSVWTGGQPRRLSALLDQYEDPADVYRVVVPRRASVRITLQSRFGDADLAAFTRSASSTADDEQLIGRSRRNGRRRDSLSLRNPSRSKRSLYAVAYIDRAARGLDAGYELSVRRVRR